MGKRLQRKELYFTCPCALFISLCTIEAVMATENLFAIFMLPLGSAEGAFCRCSSLLPQDMKFSPDVALSRM